jgi:hypothetical protein
VVPSGFVYLETYAALPTDALQAQGLRLHRQGQAGAAYFHLFQRESVAP